MDMYACIIVQLSFHANSPWCMNIMGFMRQFTKIWDTFQKYEIYGTSGKTVFVVFDPSPLTLWINCHFFLYLTGRLLSEVDEHMQTQVKNWWCFILS